MPTTQVVNVPNELVCAYCELGKVVGVVADVDFGCVTKDTIDLC